MKINENSYSTEMKAISVFVITNIALCYLCF